MITNKTNKAIDKNFDGHLEKPLNKMTPKEKLDYIWKNIKLMEYIKKNVNKKIKSAICKCTISEKK